MFTLNQHFFRFSFLFKFKVANYNLILCLHSFFSLFAQQKLFFLSATTENYAKKKRNNFINEFFSHFTKENESKDIAFLYLYKIQVCCSFICSIKLCCCWDCVFFCLSVNLKTRRCMRNNIFSSFMSQQASKVKVKKI